MNKLKEILMLISEYIEKVMSYICMVLGFVMFFSVFFQILNRYVFGSSFFYWTEEVARYCMIYLAFLGANILVRRNSNTSVRFIVDRIKGVPRIIIEYFIKISMMIFSFIVFAVAFVELPKYSLYERSTSLMMSMLIPKSSVIVGMLLVFLQLVISITVDIISRYEKTEEKVKDV